MGLKYWIRRRPYEKAIEVYRRDGSQPLKLAHAIRHLGDVHYDAGRADLAEPCFLEAIALYNEHEKGASLDFANAVRRMAVLKDDAGEAVEAVRLWQDTYDRYAAVSEPMGMAESAAHLALLAKADGDEKLSRAWLQKATEAAVVSAHRPSLDFVDEVKTKLEQ